jgi:hypothetical protein
MFALSGADAGKGSAAGDLILSKFDEYSESLFRKLEAGVALSPSEQNLAQWLKNERIIVNGVPYLQLDGKASLRGAVNGRDTILNSAEYAGRYLRLLT